MSVSTEPVVILQHRPIELSVISNNKDVDKLRTPSAVEDSSIQTIADDVPDGGHGWVVVVACSIITFFFGGLAYSWGIMQAKLASEHLAPDSTLAFIGSTTAAFISFGAIINARLIWLLGTRNAALLACSLLGGGQILSGWSTESVGGLFFTNGVIMGIGSSVCFMACGSLPAQYFKRRRGLANGIVYAGGGLGGFVLSITIDSLLNRVGIAWTFRILGFVTLGVTLPAAALLKERTRRSAATIEWSLFKDPKFLLLFFGSGIATFPLLVPPFFIPLYASSLGISTSVGAILLAVFNLSSAFGRIGFGQLCDIIGPITSLPIAMLVNALSMLAIWPVSNALTPFVIFIVLTGLGNGGFFSTIPSAVGYIYGPTRLPTALAMIVSAWAAGYMMGAPAAGYILQRYGGTDAGREAFRPAMYYAGSMSLGSASLLLTVRQMVARNFFSFA